MTECLGDRLIGWQPGPATASRIETASFQVAHQATRHGIPSKIEIPTEAPYTHKVTTGPV